MINNVVSILGGRKESAFSLVLADIPKVFAAKPSERADVLLDILSFYSLDDLPGAKALLTHLVLDAEKMSAKNSKAGRASAESRGAVVSRKPEKAKTVIDYDKPLCTDAIFGKDHICASCHTGLLEGNPGFRWMKGGKDLYYHDNPECIAKTGEIDKFEIGRDIKIRTQMIRDAKKGTK